MGDENSSAGDSTADGFEDVDGVNSLPGVCVVTHPLNQAGENATRTIMNVLSANTTVSLVTADLPENSSIWDDHPVFEVSEYGAGQSNVFTAVYHFLRNQFRMSARTHERDVDVILFFGATSYLIPVLFAKVIAKKIVVEPRGDVPLTLRLNWEQRMPAPLARTLAGLVRHLRGCATVPLTRSLRTRRRWPPNLD
nr:hypothetical protein [Halobaculum saliterrae]